MENILKEINAVLGVHGSFVCLNDGTIAAHALPDKYTGEQIQLAARVTSQTFQALEMSGQRVAEMDWVYSGGRLVIKNLRGASLVIVCARNINLPLLNLTANVAAKKIAAEIKAQSAPPPSAKQPTVAAPPPPSPAPAVAVAEPTAPAPPNPLHAQLEQEAQRVLQEAKSAALALCVMDPLAIWAICSLRPQWLMPARKRQIEFAARAEQADALTRLFQQLGYETNPRFNEFFNQRRLNFVHPVNFISVDVFLDTFEMYHRIDLTPALRQGVTHLPFIPLLLTRLQLVEISHSALNELCALLFEHNLSLVPQSNAVDVSPLTQLCAEEWGWYKTTMQNLDRVQRFAEKTLAAHERDAVIPRVNLLQSGLHATPKSLRWQARARLGETMRWYETPRYPNLPARRPDRAIE